MKFKKENDNHVKIQTADGAWYELHKKSNIQFTRWLNASPYQLQDELKITLPGLMLFIDTFAALAKKDNISKAELQNEISRLSEMLRQKVLMALDIDTIRLQLASIYWQFPDENPDELDISVMAKKSRSNESQYSLLQFFFAESTTERNIRTYLRDRYGSIFGTDETSTGSVQDATSRYMSFLGEVLKQDIDDLNMFHYTIFDNDIIKVKALEKETVFGYYATLDSVIRAAKKKAEATPKNNK